MNILRLINLLFFSKQISQTQQQLYQTDKQTDTQANTWSRLAYKRLRLCYTKIASAMRQVTLCEADVCLRLKARCDAGRLIIIIIIIRNQKKRFDNKCDDL